MEAKDKKRCMLRMLSLPARLDHPPYFVHGPWILELSKLPLDPSYFAGQVTVHSCQYPGSCMV
jgi:hypothetical protein